MGVTGRVLLPGDRSPPREDVPASDSLEPVIDGDKPQHILLTGPSGASKTSIARVTIDRLQERVLDIHTAQVNCWLHGNDFRIFYKLLEGVYMTYGIHLSTPIEELLQQLRGIDRPYLSVPQLFSSSLALRNSSPLTCKRCFKTALFS